jgi:hypothetical protein
MVIEYPSSGFSDRALKALLAGSDVVVSVREGWRSRWLSKHVKSFARTREEALNPGAHGRKFPSLLLHMVALPIPTVHNFALSEGYVMDFEEGDRLKISYSKSAN